jgi:hypothetical protein
MQVLKEPPSDSRKRGSMPQRAIHTIMHDISHTYQQELGTFRADLLYDCLCTL